VPVAKAKNIAKNPMKELRSRLSDAGVKRKFLNEIVLPSWWEESHALTSGGFREAASYICAHLGFSLKSLLDPRAKLAFYHQGGVKYKKAKGVTVADVCLSTHLALGVARAVASAFSEKPTCSPVPAPKAWRDELLAKSDRPWVGLRHILNATWELGIPIIHLRCVPTTTKKPDALTTMVGDRPVIVILNGRKSPSWIAFIVAHELGHIHRKHLKPGQTLVDEKIDSQSEEKEEVEANDFAAILLTGTSDLGLHSSSSLGCAQLADQATIFGKKYRIAPGVAALNYGFTTGLWAVANGAVAQLEKPDDAGLDLKKAMDAHLDPDDMSEESWEWIARATSAGA
jgi:hypothetical protein